MLLLQPHPGGCRKGWRDVQNVWPAIRLSSPWSSIQPTSLCFASPNTWPRFLAIFFVKSGLEHLEKVHVGEGLRKKDEQERNRALRSIKHPIKAQGDTSSRTPRKQASRHPTYEFSLHNHGQTTALHQGSQTDYALPLLH